MNEKDKALIRKYHTVRKRKRRRIFFLFVFFSVSSITIYIVFNNINQSPTVAVVVNEKEKEEDTEKPVLELTTSDLKITQGSSIPYRDYIQTVTDNIDGNVINHVIYNEIDTNVVGNHTIVYEVKDKAGNHTSAILNVTIMEKQQEENHQIIDSSPPIVPVSPTPQQNTQPAQQTPNNHATAQFFSTQAYGNTDNAMNACYSYMETNGGVCKPIRDPQNGAWLGYQFTP